MLSGERASNLSRHSLNFPVGLLITSPKRRLARLGRKHSNGSLQSNLSDTTAKSGEAFGVRQPARSKIKRHNRGLGTVFRGRSFKDQRASEEEGGDTDDPTELSTQVTAPGVLKIFGDEICAGANYKSVLATPCSSAQELVKEALERYSLDKSSGSDYVLCDVIGRSDEDHQWRTECFRVVSDNEKPLILQSLWKPKEGFARRFEIRRKVDVDEIAAKEKDTVTAGINAQARRLQMTRARASSALTDEEIETSFALWRSVSELNLSMKTRESRPSIRSARIEALDPEEDKDRPCLSIEKEETESSDGSSTQFSIHPPFDFPYFLLLQGYCSRQDFIIYVLSGASHIFGRYLEEWRGEENERARVDIALSAPDISARHCCVRRRELTPGGECGEVVMVVRPGKGAPVTHNGVPLDREAQLHPGDLLGMGTHYLFMYKDPTLASSLGHRPAWFPSPVLRLSPGGELQCKMCGCTMQDARQRTGKAIPRLRDSHGTQYVLTYRLSQEDALLNSIIDTAEEETADFKLTPAFLLSLCIQHSATSFHPADFRKLLLRIASQIQTVMWEKTKELAAKQKEHASEEAPAIGLTELIPGLRPLVYWMANSIELLHFIQHEVPTLLAWEQHKDQYGCHADQLSATKAASEEAMTVLEEVIMFTFQQSVYYLTKTLYTVLPGLLDSNPFAAERTELIVPQGVKNVLVIFEGTLSLLKQYQVHSEITSQLFTYLFFFTNASLFNALMERGSGGGFYHWSKGVQIRANLDLLLDCIQGMGLGDQATEFFLKLSTAVNLLATPKANLLQANWRCLRSDFVSLNPAQLHHMLREYNPGRACPPAWSPVREDQPAALSTADILESFDNHPPLILPSSIFHIELDKPVAEYQGLPSQLERVQEFLHRLELPATPGQTSCTPTQQNTGPVPEPVPVTIPEPDSELIPVTIPELDPEPAPMTAPEKDPEPDPVTAPEKDPEPDPVAVPVASAPSCADVLGQHAKQGTTHHCTAGAQPVYRGKFTGMGRSLFLAQAPGSLRSCQAELAHKLKSLELQSNLPGHQDLAQKKLALDPSCLLTPPNTPQILELAEGEGDPMEAACRRMVNGEQPQPRDSSRPKDSLTPQGSEADDEVFTVELETGPCGLGLALVDGQRTRLSMSGIYIKSLVPDSPAAACGKLKLGDRILAVNGSSLVGLDYQSGRELIRSSGNKLWLLVAKSDSQAAMKVLTPSG